MNNLHLERVTNGFLYGKKFTFFQDRFPIDLSGSQGLKSGRQTGHFAGGSDMFDGGSRDPLMVRPKHITEVGFGMSPLMIWPHLQRLNRRILSECFYLS